MVGGLLTTANGYGGSDEIGSSGSEKSMIRYWIYYQNVTTTPAHAQTYTHTKYKWKNNSKAFALNK